MDLGDWGVAGGVGGAVGFCLGGIVGMAGLVVTGELTFWFG